MFKVTRQNDAALPWCYQVEMPSGPVVGWTRTEAEAIKQAQQLLTKAKNRDLYLAPRAITLPGSKPRPEQWTFSNKAPSQLRKERANAS
jgi:hypothetical protein